MSSEVLQLVNKLNAEWHAFKSENDRRLEEAKKNGGRADPLTEEKINKHSLALGELQAQLDEMQKAAQRRGPADERDAVEAKRREEFRSFIRRDGLQAKATSIRAAVSVGSDPAGGYAIPETLDSTIEKYAKDGNPMREVCSVMALSNEKYEKLVEEGAAGAGWLTEGGAPSETTTPTLRALKPYFGEMYAEPKTTQKALDDIAIDVEAWLAEAVGQKFAATENSVFTSGTGVVQPRGILDYTMSTSVDGTRAAGSIQKVHSGSSGAFTATTLIDVVHALHKGYRSAGAAWMCSTLSLAELRKLKDSTSGLYLFQPSFLAGEPSTILGYPVIENEDVPDPAADSLSLLFGNFKRAYTIYDVKGLTILRDPFTSKGHVKFFTTKRVGGMVINDRAVKVLALSA